jgi:hypothetical protein
MKNLTYIILTFLMVISFVGCSGAKEGFAPSTEAPAADQPAVIETGWEYEMNQAQKITTVSNWEAVMGSQEISETYLTSNGWTAEVSHD